MNPRESSLLNAAAVLLARHGQDAAYGPAHAVRDALEIEKEVAQQAGALGSGVVAEVTELYRKVGAV